MISTLTPKRVCSAILPDLEDLFLLAETTDHPQTKTAESWRLEIATPITKLALADQKSVIETKLFAVFGVQLKKDDESWNY